MKKEKKGKKRQKYQKSSLFFGKFWKIRNSETKERRKEGRDETRAKKNSKGKSALHN